MRSTRSRPCSSGAEASNCALQPWLHRIHTFRLSVMIVWWNSTDISDMFMSPGEFRTTMNNHCIPGQLRKQWGSRCCPCENPLPCQWTMLGRGCYYYLFGREITQNKPRVKITVGVPYNATANAILKWTTSFHVSLQHLVATTMLQKILSSQERGAEEEMHTKSHWEYVMCTPWSIAAVCQDSCHESGCSLKWCSMGNQVERNILSNCFPTRLTEASGLVSVATPGEEHIKHLWVDVVVEDLH